MVTTNMKSTDEAVAPAQTIGLSHTANAYGIGAAVAILFNTALAWVKDSYESLNTAMAHTLGHHWTTHGVIVVAVFVLVGYGLSRRKNDVMTGQTPIYALVISVAAAGLGLLAWFAFV
jgi:hypothetical protein